MQGSHRVVLTHGHDLQLLTHSAELADSEGETNVGPEKPKYLFHRGNQHFRPAYLRFLLSIANPYTKNKMGNLN